MILEGLNPEQIQAVHHIDGPLLLLAGAGSGKTKTITTRLAYLIKEVGIPASSILCLTFTNKASAEMRERSIRLIGNHLPSYPLLCTFHKFGLLFLKKYISLLERSSSFVVLDGDDVKKIIKTFKSSFAPSVILGYISHYKNQMLSAEEVLKTAKSRESKEIASLYHDYQQYLESKNLLDFDDLLYLPYLIFEQNPSLASEISQQYAYIMVDEYQDTNLLQYQLLRFLSSAHHNLCVVGDEDQSIYGWRGADIRNILEFEKDFDHAKIIRLEKNYRSTPQILEFANNLISHNTQRLGKTLYSMQESGESVRIEGFLDEKQEVQHIATKIQALVSRGVSYGEIAVLYRLNALSRAIEEGFNRAKIPYKLIGAMPFYERAEIKDALSYFRLMVNLEDDFSLLRVVNRPKRGLGKVSQERLEEAAKEKNCSIYELYLQFPDQIAAKTLSVLEAFFALIEELKLVFQNSLEQFIALFEKKVPLIEEFNEFEQEDRRANLNELFALLREFMQGNPELKMEDFLNDLSLSSSSDEKVGERVSCMSMHLSKGLEFDYVFVIACEDGFFPLESEGYIQEEERRLGYVAFTRAKKELFLSYVTSRFYRGKRQSLPPSRFLKEARKSFNPTQQPLCKDSLVKHKVFGIGRVEEIVSEGSETKARVNFGGNKRLILADFLELVE